ncbi:hypothetical protein X971_3446 [Agrobacterium tumefaciens LBA4213 (Ach5)]|nr:hypothetical protein X971_3446 [Agrobacterium tumefaciens LBA4213 (Ach5)]
MPACGSGAIAGKRNSRGSGRELKILAVRRRKTSETWPALPRRGSHQVPLSAEVSSENDAVSERIFYRKHEAMLIWKRISSMASQIVHFIYRKYFMACSVS